MPFNPFLICGSFIPRYLYQDIASRLDKINGLCLFTSIKRMRMRIPGQGIHFLDERHEKTVARSSDD
jgi:hypothetical protein